MTEHDEYSAFTIPLGDTESGAGATWKPRTAPHLAIVGAAGAGKTVATHGVIQSLAQAGWRTWLIDGKRVEFNGYRNWPNVEFLANELDHQIRVLKIAHETMEARYDLIEKGEVKVADLAPIAVVIDELSAFLMRVKDRYQDTKAQGMPTAHPALSWIQDIARLGRTAKIHLVVSLQRPDASITGGEMWDNFGARVSFGNLLSKEASMMMWGDPEVGLTVPAHPKGRGVALVDGKPQIIQGRFTPTPGEEHSEDHEQMLVDMLPAVTKHPRRLIATLPAGAAPSWQQILDADVLDSRENPVEFPIV